ncbi:MAG TPA: hypothetical protein VGI58_13080 [Streptosporangiaceae bacterium]
MTLIYTIIVIVALAFFGVYLSWRAGRLDRLHARLEGARFALDAALVRRSSVALELASSGLLDPATSVLLAGAAHDARSARSAREMPESDLTRALRAVFGQPGFRTLLAGQEGAEELLTELEGAAHQVFLARKFYNDAVAATQAARQRWLARIFRLAGSAPNPEFFEIDDSLVPAGEAVPAADMPHLTDWQADGADGTDGTDGPGRSSVAGGYSAAGGAGGYSAADGPDETGAADTPVGGTGTPGDTATPGGTATPGDTAAAAETPPSGDQPYGTGAARAAPTSPA